MNYRASSLWHKRSAFRLYHYGGRSTRSGRTSIHPAGKGMEMSMRAFPRLEIRRVKPPIPSAHYPAKSILGHGSRETTQARGAFQDHHRQRISFQHTSDMNRLDSKYPVHNAERRQRKSAFAWSPSFVNQSVTCSATLPRTCASSRWRCASCTCARRNTVSMCGATFPASIRRPISASCAPSGCAM